MGMQKTLLTVVMVLVVTAAWAAEAAKTPYSSPLLLQYLLAGIQFALGDLPADTTPSEK